MSTRVYKICDQREWEGHAVLRGSADDRRDGFIHLSTAAQVPRTLGKHFAGRRDLLLLAFEIEELGDQLRWEPAVSGELFPHYYGDLAIEQIKGVGHMPEGADGRPFIPEAWRREDGELDPG